MKRLRKVVILLPILLILFGSFNSSVHALVSIPGPLMPEKVETNNPPDGGTEVEKETAWYIPGWVDDLMDSFRKMGKTFEDLMSGKLIYDAIEGLIVLGVDQLLTPVMGVFAKSYLFSPRVAEIGVVYQLWSILTIIGIIAIIVGIGVLVFKILSGKKDMKMLLKVFVGCAFACIFSLTGLNILNVGVNWLNQGMMEGVIGTTGIAYSGLGGEDVLKALVIGSDAITDPQFAGMTLGELTVETEGGIFTLLGVVLFEVLPLFIVTVLKTMVLILLAALVPIWITLSAYNGRWETMLGFLNLYTRTLIVGFLLALHWAIFVKAQTDYGSGAGLPAAIGVHPVWFSIISVTVLILVCFVFWYKPLVAGIKSPMTLAGGEVVEKLGEWGKRGSHAVNAIGKRFGLESLQEKSLDWSNRSERMAEIGRNLQDSSKSGSILSDKIASSLTNGASEVLKGVQYEGPKEWMKQTGDVVTVEQGEVSFGNDCMLNMDSTALRQSLESQQFEQAVVLQVPTEQQELLSESVPSLIKKYGNEALHWEPDKGRLVMRESVDSMLQDLTSASVSTDNLQHGLYKEGVFVDMQSLRMEIILSVEETNEIYNEVTASSPTFVKVELQTEKEAEQVFEQLQQSDLSWASSAQLDKGALWLPEAVKEAAAPVISAMRSQVTKMIRMDMPEGSRFMSQFIADLKKDRQYDDLLEGIQASPKDNYLMVHEEQLGSLQSVFDSYRSDKTPYWRTRKGHIKVIKDGVPLDFGGVPINGLDMGSFERLQSDMMRKRNNELADQG